MADYTSNESAKKLYNKLSEEAPDCCDEWYQSTRRKALESLGRQGGSSESAVIAFPTREESRNRVWDWLIAGTAAAVLVGGAFVAQFAGSTGVDSGTSQSVAASPAPQVGAADLTRVSTVSRSELNPISTYLNCMEQSEGSWSSGFQIAPQRHASNDCELLP